MPIDNRTPNKNLQLPDAANKLSEDVLRLIAALNGIDGLVAALEAAQALKAGINHTHTVGDIANLQNQLDGKMASNQQFSLDQLSDVSVAGAANDQVVMKVAATWVAVSLAASHIKSGTFAEARMPSYLQQAQLDTRIATAITALVDSAPGTLDTLNELAAALGDDPDFAATIAGQIGAVDARVTALEAAPAAFTYVESGPLNYQSDTNVEWLHGQAGVPVKFGYFLRCSTAGNGFAVGDVAQVDSVGDNSFQSCTAHATRMTFRANNAVGAYSPDSGSSAPGSAFDLILWGEWPA